MATAAAIDRDGGVVMRSSGLVVDASRVDERGYLIHVARGAHRIRKSEVDVD